MREKKEFFAFYADTIEQLGGNGLILVSGKKANPMTIGWGTIGIIWGLPVFTVLVRPSRYTYGLLEECLAFTVNVPAPSMHSEVAFCGSSSGRDVDKIAQCGFTLEKSHHIDIPYIKECPIHYECRVVHKNRVTESTLERGIINQYYPAGDFHTVYYGEILGLYAEKR
jgi:flavin reductase (DIM6/NTAB) family NADH-FMN oxidoreductase RutF